MEIIALLREERAALVARVSQIDKMLEQYEEWGREAQRLLSLMGTQTHDSGVASPVRPTLPAVSTYESSVELETHGSGEAATPVSIPTVSLVTGRKTPIRQFEAAVLEVLQQSAEPMDRVALYNALTSRGVVIGSGSRDKDMNALSARVYRMMKDPNNRLLSVRGQGYRLLVDGEIVDPETNTDNHTEGDESDPRL